MKRLATTVAAAVCLLLAACASGPSRRVSEPAANIQQLTVRADGSWSLDLGSPGGAAKMGVIDKDHPLVAALSYPQNEE